MCSHASWSSSPNRVDVAEQQRLLHLERLALERVQRVDRRLAARSGSAATCRSMMFARLARLAHVAEQQPVLELAQDVGADAQRVHDRRVRVELDEVEAAERRGVLVLPAAREPQVDALDAVRQLGDLVAR